MPQQLKLWSHNNYSSSLWPETLHHRKIHGSKVQQDVHVYQWSLVGVPCTSPVSEIKILNQLKKIHASRDWCHMLYTNFGGRGLFGFGDTVTFKNSQIPFPTMDYSPWSSKNLINQNRLKKFMKVDVDVTYMYIDFGGCDLSGFRDTVTFKNGQISLSDHSHQKI